MSVLDASKGLIVAPAGCGKKHLITGALGFVQSKPYLVLTHTTAGVTALKKQLSCFAIPTQNYVVTTIDGWALKIAGCFPRLCPLSLGPENPREIVIGNGRPFALSFLENKVVLLACSNILSRITGGSTHLRPLIVYISAFTIYFPFFNVCIKFWYHPFLFMNLFYQSLMVLYFIYLVHRPL
ncbi:TPA: hypothetical protein ACJGVM_004634 [Salmonella enterica subsp. enterica serovar Welikade]